MPSKAAVAEATTDTVEVTWREQTFTVPVRWTIRTLEAVRKGDWMDAVPRLLGPEQWARFADADPEPVLDDLGDLIGAISRALGFTDQGE